MLINDITLDNVPEGLEKHFKEVDGKFVLDVNGVVNQSEYDDLNTKYTNVNKQIDEFRTNNINLKKQLESDVGSDKKIEELVNEALKPVQTKLNEEQQRNQKLQHILEEVVLSDGVKDIAIKHGVHETALSDVVRRAREVFTVKEGKAIVKDQKLRDGEGNVFTTQSWIKQLAEKDAPHLFKVSTGGGGRTPAGGKPSGDPVSSVDRIKQGLEKLGKS